MTDDIDQIKNLLTAPDGPSPTAVAAAECRLAAEFHAPVRRFRPRLWRRSRLRVPRVAFGLAALGTAAATVAAAITLMVPHDSGQSLGTDPMSARQILLAAADTAANKPDAGRYWRTELTSTHIDHVQPPGNPPELTPPFRLPLFAASCAGEVWAGRTPAVKSWMIIQRSSAHLLSDDDRAIWRKLGSPSYGWCDLGFGGYADTYSRPQTHRVGPGTTNAYPAVNQFKVTFAQIATLPTDPAGLKRVLQSWTRQQTDKSAAWSLHDPDSIRESLAFQLSDLLFFVPAPSPVRAAALRLLADLPLTKAGTVRDPLGRRGIALAMTFGPYANSGARGPAALRWIVDPRTHTLLTKEIVDVKTGRILDSISVRSAIWTNATPDLPAKRS